MLQMTTLIGVGDRKLVIEEPSILDHVWETNHWKKKENLKKAMPLSFPYILLYQYSERVTLMKPDLSLSFIFFMIHRVQLELTICAQV